MARAVACVCVAAALLSAPAAAETPSGTARVQQLEQLVLVQINEVRKARGLPLLRRNAALEATALGHSFSMAEGGYFSHTSADGGSFAARVGARYRSKGYRFWSAGENIVWASPDLSAQEAVEMWMNSPPHRANLLSRKWREIGLGGVRATLAPGVFGDLPATILTADFGVRR